jgi:Ion channel
MIELCGIVIGTAMIVVVLVDAFEVVILPRRVRHGFRLSRVFYRCAWKLGRSLARLFPPGRWRHGVLSIFGPLSVFGLVIVWAGGLICGFGLIQWSVSTQIQGAKGSFFNYLYFSATTFFTLGYGDLVPTDFPGRALSVVEAGMGYVFLAVIISYLPVLYQAFSRREITISLLDARAGSPPSGGEFLRRLNEGRSHAQPFLAEWERWAAELLESHISYPMLSFYRSQHENQSWVAALTTILDTCALLIVGGNEGDKYQARLTFAMARHAAVDLALVFATRPLPPPERLSEAALAQLRATCTGTVLTGDVVPATAKALHEIRALYEPFVNALANYFLFPLPPFVPDRPPVDNWQTSPWTPRSPGLGGLAQVVNEDHFD